MGAFMGRVTRIVGLIASLAVMSAGLAACHQEGGEPDNVPPADAGSVSADSAMSGMAMSDSGKSPTADAD